MNELVTVAQGSNRDFLERYAKPGSVGLVGGTTLIESRVRRDATMSFWVQRIRRAGHE